MNITGKKYKSKNKKGLGGIIGKGAGFLAGIPLGNPGLGAKMGGMAGEFVEGQIADDPKQTPQSTSYAPSSYGYASGGFLDFTDVMPQSGGYPDVAASDTTKSKPLPIRTSTDKQDENANLEKIMRDRMKRMKEGDFSMVGESIQDSLKQKKKRGGSISSVMSPMQKAYKEGKAKPIGQDALEVQGKSHEEGGVDIDNNTEVEGKETMDKVGGQDYVFSKRLKVPGSEKSFAQVHKEMVKNNADPEKIEKLAQLQEKVAGRNEV